MQVPKKKFFFSLNSYWKKLSEGYNTFLQPYRTSNLVYHSNHIISLKPSLDWQNLGDNEPNQIWPNQTLSNQLNLAHQTLGKTSQQLPPRRFKKITEAPPKKHQKTQKQWDVSCSYCIIFSMVDKDYKSHHNHHMRFIQTD